MLSWLSQLFGRKAQKPLISNTAAKKSRRRRVQLYSELLEGRLAPVAGLTSANSQLLSAYGQLPLSFEANQGQTGSQVQFLSRGSGYALFLTSTGATLSLQQLPAGGSAPSAPPASVTGVALAMNLVGANPEAMATGQDQLPGTSNYFIGNDLSQWHTGIANYGQVAYQDVYPGVNLVYYGNQSQLEYDFVVGPGADPGSIRFNIQGADSVSLDDHGNLVLNTALGDVVEHAPVVYQEAGGVRQAVDGQFVLLGNNEVGFRVGAYDASLPLTIDPVLTYSTYLGGNNGDFGQAIAVDSSGNAYITGSTDSTDFPTTAGAFQISLGGSGNAFVTKLNASGTALVYSTYLGGNNNGGGYGIAVDSSGNAYIVGVTGSTDFPTTAGAFQTSLGGTQNAFVTKLNASGTALGYSTYLGGNSSDIGYGIAVDGSGNAYVTGLTNSTNFPTTAGAFQTSLGGGTDAFVTKLNASGTALGYSTYLGGGDRVSVGNGIAVDGSGNAFVTGYTSSANFPTTGGAFQTSNGAQGGSFDAFVTKLNSDGTALVYSTYLGGNSNDVGYGIAVDGLGNAYVTGSTESTNFPITAGAFQTSNNNDGGSGIAFVTKLNAGGTALVYSTYLGGNSSDVGYGIAVDGSGDAYVTGRTYSTDFPTTAGAFQTSFEGDHDAFVTKLNAGGTALVYSTYLGGNSRNVGYGIAVDGSGNAFITGYTSSTNFSTTAGAFQPNSGGGEDAFVTKFSFTTSTTTSLSTSNPTITYGTPAVFTASVTASAGSTAPTAGSVDFFDTTTNTDLGDGTFGSSSSLVSTWTLTTGVKTFNVTTGDVITATYSPGDGFLGSSGTVTQAVTPMAITVTASTNTRAYDGTTAAANNPTIASGSLVAGDTAVFVETYDNRNAGTGKTLTASGSVNDGNGGSNYVVTFVTVATGNITPRFLVLEDTPNTKVYDGTRTALATPTVISGSLALGDTAAFTETYDTENAGTNEDLFIVGSVNDGNNGNNYSVAESLTNIQSGAITARPITVTAVTNSKVYDGTVSASNSPTITSGSLVLGDTAVLSETYDTKNAGTSKTLTASGSIIDGNGGNNYRITFVVNTTGQITARAITVTALTNTKGYDGTTSATNIPTITSGSLATGDTAAFTDSYDTKNVGTGKTLTASGSVNDGNGGDNYSVTYIAATTGQITIKAITVTSTTNTKVYDGSTLASNTPTITSGSVATGDTAAFTETYDTKNVGTGKTLTSLGSVNDGNGGNNYAVTFNAGSTGQITARAITVTAATNTKPYDGTTSASNTPIITTGALATGDTATFSETYATSNLGTGKTLTATGSVNDGNGGSNYAVTLVENTTGQITARSITVTASTNTKGYDGTNSAGNTPTITGGSLLAGDTAVFTESYDTKNAGTGKTLAATGSVNDGNGGNNYLIKFVTNTTGQITARAITVTAATNTKIYDGTTSASNLPTITSGTLAGGDTTAFSESYDTKNVGSGKTLTATGSVSDGNGGNNYTVTFITNTTGQVTQRAITVTASTNTKVYDGTTSASNTPSITSGTLATGDTPAFSETYDTRNEGAGKTLTAGGTVNDGNGGANYTVTFATNTTGQITVRAITVTAATNTKGYDGTTSASNTPTITTGTLGSGDTTAFSESYDTSLAGTGKTLTPTGSVSDGNGGANYAVTFTKNTTGQIFAWDVTDGGPGVLDIVLFPSQTITIVANATSYTFTSNQAFVAEGPTDPANQSANFSGLGTTTLTLTSAGLAHYTTGINIADSGTGSTVTFNNSGTNSYVNNFNVTLSNAAAGSISFNGNSNFGAASLTASTTFDILANSGASLTSSSGNLTLQANEQVSATSGAFSGITINGAAITTTGSGTITLQGRSGTSNGVGIPFGIYLQPGATITGGTGPVIVSGTGGAAPGGGSYGVYMIGETSSNIILPAVITSTGGNVQVSGQGGSSSNGSGYGIYLATAAKISAGGTGTVSVTGTGGMPGGNDYGVYLASSTSQDATITSSGGNVQVTGNAGGGANAPNDHGVYLGTSAQISAGGQGSVTVTGMAGVGGGYGVDINGSDAHPGIITSGGGNVLVTGTAQQGESYGVYVGAGGRIMAGGAGTVTVVGYGGLFSGGSSYGVYLNGDTANSAVITSGGGNVVVTGIGSPVDALDNNIGVAVGDGGQITAGGMGTVTVSGTGGSAGEGGNDGVLVSGPSLPATITSSGGAVQITGTGGDFGYSFGVYIAGGGLVTAGGNATVTITGTGGTTGGPDYGVDVASQVTSGGGNVVVTGFGGNSSGNYGNNDGVFLDIGGLITAGGNGTVTVQGTGGTTPGSGDYGVAVAPANGGSSKITSGGNSVTVIGLGGGSGGSSQNNDGVYVGNAGTITAGHMGSVTVTGTGGPTTGGSDYGVLVGAGQVTSGGGPVQVTGTGGGSGTSANNIGVDVNGGGVVTAGASGTVNVQGTGGLTIGSSNFGIFLDGGNNASSTISSSGGNIQIVGKGGGLGSSASDNGVDIFYAGQVKASSSGILTINGTGGASTGTANNGVNLQGSNGISATISTGGAAVQISGAASGTSSVALAFSGYQILGPTAGAAITLVGDSMQLTSGVILAGSQTVSLAQQTPGTMINLGGANAAGTLDLANAEIGQIFAGALQIGNGASGTMTVSAPIALASASNVTLASGANIIFNPGSINTGGGALTLMPGSTGAVEPISSGTDVSLGSATLSFAANANLAFAINGSTVDTGYNQLSVVGKVNLSGTNLDLSSSLAPVAGQSFVIVNNQGSSPISGIFNGLPEGAVITNFLGSGLNAVISYTGGDGNDVVLNVNAALTATSTSLTSSASTVTYGQAVTFAATITAAAGQTAPNQGAVDFTDTTTHTDFGNGVFSGSNGSISTWAFTTGPKAFNVTPGDVITARYSPGSGFLGSSGTVAQIVTARPITVTAATNTKDYDGTTSATSTPTITGGSVVSGDTAAFTEAYETANAGTGKTLTPLGSVSDGNGGSNYVITFVSNATGIITSGTFTIQLIRPVASEIAGVPFAILVTATDGQGHTVSNYNGTITLTSSDTEAVFFPSTDTITAGVGIVVGELKTAGSATITATDALGNLTGTTSPITVVPAATSQLALSGIPPSIITGTPFSLTVTAEDAFGNPTPTYTGTVHFTSTDPRISPGSGLPANYTFTTGPGQDNGVHTFTNDVTLLTPASQTVTVSDGSSTGTSSVIRAVGLQVTSVVGNATGFTVNLNKPFDPTSLKLYGTTLNNPGLLFYMTNTVVGPAQLTGSVVPNAADTAFTFVETTFANEDGGLPNGVYDVSLLSSTNGLRDMSGTSLDASNSPTNSPNLYSTLLGQSVTAYSTSFTLSTITSLTDTTQNTPTEVAVSLPAFAQGPGLPVHVQVHDSGGAGGTVAGIPATISDGNNASTISFSVTYDTALLTVTGGVVDPSILAGYPNATFSRSATGTPVAAMETDTFTFSTGDSSLLAKGSAWTLGDITATVPNTAGQQIYKDKQVLTASNISSNGTVTNLVGGNGFQVVAYLGDASGDGNIQLNDATQANNVGNAFIGGGFAAYHMVDPVVVADTDGAGFVDSSSVGNIASLAIGHAQPTIPTPPQGRITSSGGADPDLSLPGQLQAADGLVELPVNLDNVMPTGSTGLTEATLDLTYDPRVLTVSASDVHVGSLPSLGTGWTVASVVNQAAGQLVIQLYSMTPLTVSAAGSLVIVDFHTGGGWRVAGGGNAFDSPLARHPSPLISLVDWANPTGQVWFRTSLSDTNGALTLGNSTSQASVGGAGQVASGETSVSAVMATNAVNATAGANAETEAQASDIVESLAYASGSEGDAVSQRTGTSGVPSDPATVGMFQFGSAPLINVLPLASPMQLLTAAVFSDLDRQMSARDEQVQGLMDYDQAIDGSLSVVSAPALEELFAQLGLEYLALGL